MLIFVITCVSYQTHVEKAHARDQDYISPTMKLLILRHHRGTQRDTKEPDNMSIIKRETNFSTKKKKKEQAQAQKITT